jgi:deferrochelatase/peroxidase EfeB
MTGAVDFADVQGIVRYGYKHLTEACYYLLRVKDAGAARAWLLDAPVTNAVEQQPPPPAATQVAFTAPGLRALRVPEGVVSGFSYEFIAGMAGDASRSRRLGDVGANAPSSWRWGTADRVPHLVVMLFAQPDGLAAHEARLVDARWRDAFDVIERLDTSDLGGFEQFGFRDGVSQPVPDWERTRDPKGFQDEYGNVVALGEILLGYPNEYRKYTARPLVADGPAAARLPGAEDEPAMRDVGRNGTFVVLRDLRQDVRAFWRFVGANVVGAALDSNALAAALVGRALGGEPLVPVRPLANPGDAETADQIRLNGFTFEADPDGERCPFGAHIRRANPRNADFPHRPSNVFAFVAALLGFGSPDPREDLVSSVRFHRVLRRGREYGPGLSPTEARRPAPPDDPERGLRFVGINANILRQFEFLQNAWLRNPRFDGLSGESDPLLGNREPTADGAATDAFTLQRPTGLGKKLTGLPQFVTVRGGAYFFLPGLRALRYLAEAGA